MSVGKWAAPAAVCVLVFAASAAAAGTITRTYEFEGDGFADVLGSATPPIDPLFGDATVTFDPTVTATDVTTGILLNNLNVSLGSQIAWSYDPVSDILSLGGLGCGGVANVCNGENDFRYDIHDPAGAFPVTSFAEYTSASYPQSIFEASGGEIVLGAVPEPASWVTMMLGAGLLGLAARRRRTAAA